MKFALTAHTPFSKTAFDALEVVLKSLSVSQSARWLRHSTLLPLDALEFICWRGEVQ